MSDELERRIAAAEAEADRWRARVADLAAHLAGKSGESQADYGRRAGYVYGELVADLGKANPMYPAKLPLHRREMTEHYYYVILNHLKERSSGLMYGVHYYIPIIDAILAELEIYGEHNYPQTRERWQWLRALAMRCNEAMDDGYHNGGKAAYLLDQDERRDDLRRDMAGLGAWNAYSDKLPPARPGDVERQAERCWFEFGFCQGWEDADYPEDDND